MDASFTDDDYGEIEMQSVYMYDWFWNTYETYDQYKSVAGDVSGDFSITSDDCELLSLATSYTGAYDMIYGGEL